MTITKYAKVTRRRRTVMIEMDIASGTPNSEIMERYGVSYGGLQRIKQRMVTGVAANGARGQQDR